MLFALNPRSILTNFRLIASINMKPQRKFSKIFVKLPKCLIKDYAILPTVSLQKGDLKDCRYAWYREITRQEREQLLQTKQEEELQLEKEGRAIWFKLSDKLIYTPTEEDVARHLRLVCWSTDGQSESPRYRAISDCPVELGPPSCPFELRHAHTRERLEDINKFRVVSYNILADLYADSDYSRSVLFAHCPAHALDIDYRRQLLLKEIVGYNADIVCLQEVDKKEFTRVYEPFLKTLGGLSGIYAAKGGHMQEGTATFYHSEKFELVDSHRTKLSDLLNSQEPKEELSTDGGDKSNGKDKPVDKSMQHPILDSSDKSLIEECLGKFETIRRVVVSNPKLKERFDDRNTILQTSLLRLNENPANYLIVTNTHFYFAPDADHIRLLQGSICAKYLEHIREFYRKWLIKTDKANSNDNFRIDIVLCGDLNSTPDCGTYKLLTEGKVSQNVPDWLSNSEEKVVGLDVETSLRFASAYVGIEYTNYTPGFKGWLDYIYYEKDGLRCDSTVPLPSHEDVIATGGIPSEVFPSDHLALVADLELVNK